MATDAHWLLRSTELQEENPTTQTDRAQAALLYVCVHSYLSVTLLTGLPSTVSIDTPDVEVMTPTMK